jgi:hypothetical protein
MPAFICQLEDGSGRLSIAFGGARPIPGFVPGVRCTVEATALTNGRALVLWNPYYRFEPSCE